MLTKAGSSTPWRARKRRRAAGLCLMRRSRRHFASLQTPTSACLLQRQARVRHHHHVRCSAACHFALATTHVAVWYWWWCVCERERRGQLLFQRCSDQLMSVCLTCSSPLFYYSGNLPICPLLFVQPGVMSQCRRRARTPALPACRSATPSWVSTRGLQTFSKE